MNLLIDKVPNYILVGDIKVIIKTDFGLWVKFLLASEKFDNDAMLSALESIFEEGIPRNLNERDVMNGIFDWIGRAEGDDNVKSIESNTTSKQAFDFDKDGSIIYCELWEHFPHMMERGISFQEGMELITLLMANEKTLLHHRAYARCGDFSKLGKEEKKYWMGERAKYAIKAKQKDIDNIFSNNFL